MNIVSRSLGEDEFIHNVSCVEQFAFGNDIVFPMEIMLYVMYRSLSMTGIMLSRQLSNHFALKFS